MAAALNLIGEKWALLAVREIAFGNRRFDAIAKNTGAPRDRLAARLRTLEAAGVVERRLYSEHPPRYEYELTQAGQELRAVLTVLRAWGDKWAVDSPPRRSSTAAGTSSTRRSSAATAGPRCARGTAGSRPRSRLDPEGPGRGRDLTRPTAYDWEASAAAILVSRAPDRGA